MSSDGQGTIWRRNIADNLNRLTRTHERYRRQTDRHTTDGRTTTYSEREREFTFANKVAKLISTNFLLFSHAQVLQSKQQHHRIMC